MSLASKYVTYTQQEKKDLFLVSIVTAFIIFFFAWNRTDYNLASGARDIILFWLASLFSLLLFTGVPKYVATFWKYTAHYKGWIPGSLVAFAVAFTSYGYLPIIFPGMIEFQIIEKLRHGKLFPGENKQELKILLLVPILTAIILAFFFQIILLSTNHSFFYYAMMLNAFIAFFSLLPIPNNIGSYFFRMDEKGYFFYLFFTLLFVLLLLFKVQLAIFIAPIVAFIFYFFFIRAANKVLSKK